MAYTTDTRVSPEVLGEHYLYHVQCDHERGLDNPVCSCTVVNLGWHNNVGLAVRAWVEHVQAVQREVDARTASTPQLTGFLPERHE